MSENHSQIEFVNRKCGERITNLVNSLKSSFPEKFVYVKTVETDKILDKIDSEPDLVFKPLAEMSFPMQETTLPKYNSPLTKYNNYPFYLASTVDKKMLDESSHTFNGTKIEFLRDSRQEHQRLLWIFRDRVSYENFSQPTSQFKSPFKTAVEFISEQQDIPRQNKHEATEEMNQERMASIIRKAQSSSNQMIGKQKLIMKMIKDREQFQSDYSPNEGEQRKPVTELPVAFPFTKLFEADQSK